MAVKIWKGKISKDSYFATGDLDVKAMKLWAIQNGVKMSIKSVDRAEFAHHIRIVSGEELFILRWL